MEEIASSRSENLYTQRKGRNTGKLILLIVLIFIFIGAIAYGGMQFLGKDKVVTTAPTPTPTLYVFPTDPPTPTEATASPTLTIKISPTVAEKTTPTPTVKVATDTTDKTSGLDRKNLTIEILNGSGTPGVAKKASDILTGLGYKVVSTGNADNYDYATTEVSAIATKKSYLTLLSKDLSGSYTVEVNNTPLTASSSANARVIIGKK